MKSRCLWKDGPPGWVAAWLVTLTVTVSAALAVWGWAPASRLWEKSGGSLVAWVGVSLGPWLAYRAVKRIEGRKGREGRLLDPPAGADEFD